MIGEREASFPEGFTTRWSNTGDIVFSPQQLSHSSCCLASVSLEERSKAYPRWCPYPEP